MKFLSLFLLLAFFGCKSQNNQIKAYIQQAKQVTIIRDDWGIPHIYGKTDANVVFGLMYAQCEESFERVERNYIEKLGRLAEVEGEKFLLQDLKMRMLHDTIKAIKDYNNSPDWLKKLCNASVDGIHYFLYKNPDVRPIVLNRFQPWYPLLFTDGAYINVKTGGLEMKDIEALYGAKPTTSTKTRNKDFKITTGSNAFALAPFKTANHTTMLYINPHVSFHYRMEAHLISEEGLNAYGAITWGQFFIYQGFTDRYGWMHTSSMADAADLYREKITKNGKDLFYEYNKKNGPLTVKQYKLKYKREHELMEHRFTTYATHHGPVMGRRNGEWLSVKAQNHSLNELIQSWQRMKAKDLQDFKKLLELKTNKSTNTMYADNKGNIAYWHGNFIPKRNLGPDYSAPLDGTTSATEWKGLHSINEIVHVINPQKGFLQNCNSTPFSVAGFNTISRANYPAYMAPDEENFRSLLAVKELQEESSFTLDKLIAVGYSTYLSAFDSLLPPLFEAYNALPASNSYKQELAEPIQLLMNWDKKSSVSSVATTVAVLWAYSLFAEKHADAAKDKPQIEIITDYSKRTLPEKKLELLHTLVREIKPAFGTWQVPWGEINRYQRINGSINPTFDNSKSSIAVGSASSLFGCLPSFETRWYEGRSYGVAGNSFVAAVEFGDSVKAKAIATGGQSFNPASKHFSDQAIMYAEGKFRDVHFYKNDVLKHAEYQYHPGEDDMRRISIKPN